jgi:hypothetical protein
MILNLDFNTFCECDKCVYNLISGGTGKFWTSGSFLGAESVPRWCATGDPINVTSFNWGPTAGTPPSTDVTKYMTVIAMASPPYLLNALASFGTNVFAICEEY